MEGKQIPTCGYFFFEGPMVISPRKDREQIVAYTEPMDRKIYYVIIESLSKNVRCKQSQKR
jgi:hypothetical protein